MGNKKIVKISFFHGYADMSRYFSKKFFQDYIFEINNPNCCECDFWIVYGGLPNHAETTKVNPKNIFVFTTEFDGYFNQKFLNQFEKIVTVDTKLQGDKIIYGQIGLPWFINNSFDNLHQQDFIKKTKLISIVASNNSRITYSRNYKIRFDFVMALKKYFGNEIDIFGRGFKEITNKEDGLLPYKFSVAIENMPIPYVISEKINDCFLTHTFPLYYDCPNINRFYDERAYAKLDIMDHGYSITMIEKILSTPNYYEEHLDAIIEAKRKYLMEFSFQAVFVKTIEHFGVITQSKENVRIKPNNNLRSKVKMKLIDLVYNNFK